MKPFQFTPVEHLPGNLTPKWPLFWHICTAVFLQMTNVGVRSQGKEEKPSRYLHSKNRHS